MRKIVYFVLKLTTAVLFVLFVTPKAPVFGLPSVQDQATPFLAEKGFVPPASANTPPSQSDTCASSFPLNAHASFLPLVQNAERTMAPPPPTQEKNVTLTKQAGSLVPIGDQLGDVGQYYSQIAPSMVSTLTLENTTPITQTFALTLFSDSGVVAHLLEHCAVAPREVVSLQIDEGELWLLQHNQQIPVESLCSYSARTKSHSQPLLEPPLHGIYHATITGGTHDAFAISVDTATDSRQPSILYRTAGQYQAIAEQRAANTIFIPAILTTRDLDNWWDTEIIVQNVTGQTTDIQFRICDDQGRCFDNNIATLHAYERRIFLGSHLLLENLSGFLRERSGWFSATLQATTAGATTNRAKVVALSNIFKQPVASGAASPQAEYGSTCLYQSETVEPALQTAFSVTVSSEGLWRIYNPATMPGSATINVVDGQGQNLLTLQRKLGANGSSSIFAHELFSRLLPAYAGQVVSLQIHAENALVTFAWQDGKVLHAAAPDEPDATWHAPLVAAPTVEFRWDGDSDPTLAAHPGPKYGLAESAGFQHIQRPQWARTLSWYTWTAEPELCNEIVSDTARYSTYIPMWQGLGDCGASNDRSCVNSPARLYKIRNDIPSSCAGRPLFLANEPDLPAPQTFMTYHELGRMIFQLRSWPGELYSPVFASHAYDAPTYIAEPSPWCQEAVTSGVCPNAAGCTTCIQDGHVDGTVDPHDISFQGLEDYFSVEGRWVQGESWLFEDIIEGMLLHFYTVIEPFDSDTYWRAAHLMRYRDRAVEAGWPIIVNEYGFVFWPDENGLFPKIDTCTIANHVDDLRQLLQKYLGNYQPEYGYNPKKLFWFHTGCSFGLHRATDLCLFQNATSLTSPVGLCWYEDAVNGGMSNFQCNQPCAQIFLPAVRP